MLPPELLDITIYSRIKDLAIEKGLTPVLIVLGGSAVHKAPSSNSDIDLFSYHLEDVPEIVDFDDTEIRTILNITISKKQVEYISLRSHSLAYVRQMIFNAPIRIPRTIHLIQTMLGLQTIIYDNKHEDLESLRNEVSNISAEDLLNHYVLCVDEYKREFGTYQDYHYDKIALRAIRYELTKKHLEETGTIEIVFDKLIKWSGVDFDLKSFVPTFRREPGFWDPIMKEIFNE